MMLREREVNWSDGKGGSGLMIKENKSGAKLQ